MSDSTGLTSPELFQLIQWKYAMRLEMKGLHHSSGRSVCAMVKRKYGFKGNRQKVYEQFCAKHGLER